VGDPREPERHGFERYARQIALAEVGEAGQRRLRGSSVVVVGAGGLGSPALYYLAGAGIGRIGIVDDECVEVTNLHRQVLYGEGDEGALKAEAAASRLKALNPDVAVETYPYRLDSSNSIDVLRGYDVVVDATDNFEARYVINDACIRLKRPMVHGSVLRFDGQAAVFYPPQGPCYRCLFPDPPPQGAVPSCAEAGVIGTAPGVIGIVEALEALKLLLGIGEPLVGRLLVFSGLDAGFSEVVVRRDRRCPACSGTSS